MNHLKLYEQYDFEDLSDEELFGKEIKRNMMMDMMIYDNGRYYPLETRGDWVYIYNDYNWDSLNRCISKIKSSSLLSFDELKDNDMIYIFNTKRRAFDTWLKKDVPNKIREEIKNLNFEI